MSVSFDEYNPDRPVEIISQLTLAEKLSKASGGALGVNQAGYLLLGCAIVMFIASIWLMAPHRSNTVDTAEVNMPGMRP